MLKNMLRLHAPLTRNSDSAAFAVTAINAGTVTVSNGAETLSGTFGWLKATFTSAARVGHDFWAFHKAATGGSLQDPEDFS